ncbi:hypothetical protein SEA_ONEIAGILLIAN_8 [Microbacterium phage OneinaGillian]|uniref:Uncharacterized protein n=1 Tax=Microbacterium phage OneinaGillian TaxID=2301604 RepID=A0A385UF17_9CAUD|nr:hypothetical protein HOU23_gp008 [Microbacterium phage OneinaGillian]AYB70118.1 hypothetical protein SEA_ONEIAGILLIAN_8 [Microbacterium phage OneinaGillian]
MSADNAMVQRFLTALRESEEKVPDLLADGGYVTDLDDYIHAGAQIDGWWTAAQLEYAIRAAMTEEAAGDRTD